mgnify:CR=1 FL=1
MFQLRSLPRILLVVVVFLGTAFALIGSGGCVKVQSEEEATRIAKQEFRNYIARKNLQENQFKEPRITFNSNVEGWHAYYEWTGSANTKRNDVSIVVDKYGRAEFWADSP